jgi:hypothetical protein
VICLHESLFWRYGRLIRLLNWSGPEFVFFLSPTIPDSFQSSWNEKRIHFGFLPRQILCHRRHICRIHAGSELCNS